MDKLRLAAKLPVLVLTIMVTMVYVSQGVKLLESAECMLMLYIATEGKYPHTELMCSPIADVHRLYIIIMLDIYMQHRTAD